jgi:chorismate mutase
MGGNYVEPLYGRPRRMQGTILSVNAATNELTVQVAYEVTVKLPAKYKAADYLVGQRVGWDNIEIPVLEVQSVAGPVAAGSH